MERGNLIKSTTFNTNPYWVIKCENPNLVGCKNGELPIDPLSLDKHPYWFTIGRVVAFDTVDVAGDIYAKIN